MSKHGNHVSEVALQFAHSHLPFERFETKGLSVSRKSFSSPKRSTYTQRIFRIGFHERPTHARSRFEVTSRGTSGREGVKLPLNQERVFTYKYPRATQLTGRRRVYRVHVSVWMYLRACPLKLELGRPIQLAAQESKSHLAELVGSSKDGDKRRTVAHEDRWKKRNGRELRVGY